MTEAAQRAGKMWKEIDEEVKKVQYFSCKL